MKLLFLDIDGVLNDHKPLPNGYSQLKYECVMELCRILDACPDVSIIVSSAWRYMMQPECPPISHRGLEYVFCLFGAPYDSVEDRVIGTTESDEHACRRLGLLDWDESAQLDYEWLKENGCLLRREQIIRYAETAVFIQKAEPCVIYGPHEFVVLDDLDLEMLELVRTDGAIGLTPNLADEVIRRFREVPG